MVEKLAGSQDADTFVFTDDQEIAVAGYHCFDITRKGQPSGPRAGNQLKVSLESQAQQLARHSSEEDGREQHIGIEKHSQLGGSPRAFLGHRTLDVFLGEALGLR